jgi:SNF2 family DNA or RNA helicase
MLVIHAAWADGRLQLWAEDSELVTPTITAPRRDPPARHTRTGPQETPPHPFACSAPVLAAALCDTQLCDTELGRRVADAIGDTRDVREGMHARWLPATAAGPLPSPELARALQAPRPGQRTPGPPTRPGRPRLSAWQVPVLTAAATTALELLAALAGQGRAAGGLWPENLAAAGGSVRYFCAVGALAADLAGLGRVLPALCAPAHDDPGVPGAGARSPDPGTGQPGGPHWQARWRPVLTGPHAQRARDLALAMPPVCRCAAAAGEPAGQVLTSALDALTDAAVRARIGPDGPAPAELLPPRRGRRPPRIPVPERWAAALTSADALVHVDGADPDDAAEARALATALGSWRAAAQAPAGPVRTCFRLSEPAEPKEQGYPGGPGPAQDPEAAAPPAPAARPADPSGERWWVEFLLQASDDPSLVIPAAAIWAGVADGWPQVTGVAHPEEELLAGLGRAARLFPELDGELRTRAPAATSLDSAGAFRFLKETAPLLQAAGFGVLLPAWVRKSRLGLKLTTRSRRGGGGAAAGPPGFGLDELVDFHYDLAVGDHVLDPDELAELARLKVPLVRVRGQWVELDQRQLNAALKYLERRRSGTLRAGEALLAAIGADDPQRPLTEIDADGWLGDLLSGQAEQRIAAASAPASFQGTLRPYQERGLAWLSFLGGLGLGAVLADDMGLGKTVQLLALLAAERAAPEPGGATASPDGLRTPGASRPAAAVKDHDRVAPTLLVCPMSLVGNWQREAERFLPGLRVHVHHGSGRMAGPELTAALAAAELVITTYGLAARDVTALAGVSWRRVVCDEAQNIKNSSTKQAQAVRAIPAGARVALTGTPVENHLTELWSIMQFTNPGLLGAAESFRRHYAVPIERHADPGATDALKRLTGPFILRRLKTDRSVIADLPDKIEMKVWCNLTAEQATLYQATVEEMLAKIEAAEEGIERRGLVLATMAKLKQVCNHPAHLLGDGSALAGRSGKLARLEEICAEVLAEDERVLCFTQYAEFGAMLEPYLAARLGCSVLYLHGGTPKRQRDLLVAQFQDSGEPGVFLLSLKAGGTGLNLTAANHVIHVDRWWNPAVEDQATDRAFRIGQRKNVQVRKFVCVGTMEERIDAMIEQKKALAERIVGTGEAWLTDMSVEQLRDVLSLSPEAVSE